MLGPDYFFGDSVDNHPADQQMAWIASAVQPAQDAFPPWFAAVKEKFGKLDSFKFPSTRKRSISIFLGAPGTTQYFIVGTRLLIHDVLTSFLTKNAACLGYCFGGPFSLQLGATDDVLAGLFALSNIDISTNECASTAAVAHPSMVTEAHFENITRSSFQVSTGMYIY